MRRYTNLTTLLIMFKLREFRIAHSLKQSEIAEILGVAQSGISRMESERIELPIALYSKLYEKFGKEDVDAFKIFDEESTNQQVDLRLKETDNRELLAVIQKQNEIISEHIRRQDELNKRLIDLLERIYTK